MKVKPFINLCCLSACRVFTSDPELLFGFYKNNHLFQMFYKLLNQTPPYSYSNLKPFKLKIKKVNMFLPL